MFLKKVFKKKKILITGGSCLLGSNFFHKYKREYKITKYPFRIENQKKFDKWIKNKDFDYFVHFAALINNNDKKKIDLINTKSSINLLNILNKKKLKNFKFFLFISSSHVYENSIKKIKETHKRSPKNIYGLSKKKVEDFIIKNRKNFYFKIGIARIFNFTGLKQKKGFFIADIYRKIRKNIILKNVNKNRDFIHIDDVCESLRFVLKKKIEKPINISSGKKINLVNICKLINKFYFKKKVVFDLKKGEDLVGDNSQLRSLGKKKFKNINQIVKSFKK